MSTITPVVSGIPSRSVDDCPIKPGFRYHRHFGHLLCVPEVESVGRHVRVGGGWLVPVKFKDRWYRRGCGALLVYLYGDEGQIRIDDVKEHISNNEHCQRLIMNAAYPPRVCAWDDPGVLRLEVVDRHGYAHHLFLHGILGKEGRDIAIVVGDGEYDSE